MICLKNVEIEKQNKFAEEHSNNFGFLEKQKNFY